MEEMYVFSPILHVLEKKPFLYQSRVSPDRLVLLDKTKCGYLNNSQAHPTFHALKNVHTSKTDDLGHNIILLPTNPNNLAEGNYHVLISV